jgi:hypothetical protein
MYDRAPRARSRRASRGLLLPALLLGAMACMPLLAAESETGAVGLLFETASIEPMDVGSALAPAPMSVVDEPGSSNAAAPADARASRGPELKSNPFSPPPRSLTAAAIGSRRVTDVGWELNGIMLAGAASKADINGQVLGVGEEIDGYRVAAVERRQVVLVRNGARRVVSLDGKDDPDID